MGKRSGVTKSGRVMNPADRERKQMRMKELKRNKKERVKMIALYRTEKNDREVKRLETMLHDYELERFKKEQHYKALLFSQKADPDEIPLPSGSEPPPNAASTPFAPPPVAPQFHPTMKAGILKKSAQPTAKKHKYPPGPPCGLPPSLSDDDEEEEPLESRRSRKVKFSEPRIEDDEEFDYAPVEIPESMFMQEQQQNQPVYQRMPIRGGGVPIPPGMAPPPPRMAPYGSGYPLHPSAMPEIHSQSMRDRERRPGQPSGSNRIPLPDEPNTAAVISAGPQKETTKFVPTSLRVPRPNAAQSSRKAPTHHGAAMISANIKAKASSAAATGKSTDEACDDFLREIQGLL
ncbi:hypothetical protein DdX_09331 [Ditylenchus destructor]|uniref:WW domain binding protein 11 n=1 Tax=Ditylenchus destructor TaxID=166010 RepID=A0AAD4R6F8_9BILA|nr:hypothetical protein DdX_09331 [Ditylenchus destructor]